MKYYKLAMDVSGDKDIICHYSDSLGMQQYDLKMGKVFNHWKNDFQFFYFKHEGNIATDYLANDMGWFVVSSRLKKLIEDMNTEVQFLKVNILEKESSKKLEDYYIANVTKLVDALCMEESKYFETEIEKLGKIYTVSKHAIIESKANGFDVFKLPNRQEIPVFVSGKFKEIIEQNEVTGMEFLEVKVV